jgi:drug/metabolite transporter (DMT)-like permease
MIRAVLKNGFVLMLLSALFYALSDIFIKLMSPSIGSIPIAFIRFLVGGLILLPFLVRGRESLKGQSTHLLLVRGLTGTAAFFCLIKSIAMVPLSNAMVLFYTFPLFATFFSLLLLREPLKKLEVLLTFIGLTGIYILINPGAHSLSAGHAYGLLAGCFAGLTVVLIRKVRQSNGPLIIYFYFCLVGGVVSLPFYVAGFAMPNSEVLLLLVVLAVIFLIAQLFMNQGFKYCKASEGAVILMSEVVFTGVAGVLIFGDSPTAAFWIGAALIMGSGVGLNLVSRTSNSSASAPNA